MQILVLIKFYSFYRIGNVITDILIRSIHWLINRREVEEINIGMKICEFMIIKQFLIANISQLIPLLSN